MDNFSDGDNNSNNNVLINDDSKAHNIAKERLSLIRPLLDDRLHIDQVRALTREIAKDSGLSVKTLQRYLELYRKNQLNGLIPKTDGRPGDRTIPPSILEEAAKMRREIPGRSVMDIIKTLEREEKIPAGSVKRATLQEQLFKIGCGSAQLKAAQANVPRVKHFQRTERNSLWQSESKLGPNIDGQKTYLISFIDDYSRLILSSKFYFSGSIESICDCFREAITKYGTPKDVYFNKGQPSRSKVLRRVCALLEINQVYHKIYSAQSNGKIEKFNQLVDKFIDELRLDEVNTLVTLNSLWNDFLTVFYQHNSHHGLPNEMTPEEAFTTDSAPFRFISQEKCDQTFLQSACGRKIDRSGRVSFQGKKYAASALNGHIGEKVNIFWDPTNPSKLWIQIENRPLMEATEVKSVNTDKCNYNI
jgi:transposase InsO family protein